MSGKNRAARRRAERKHGGPPPDYWNDYRRELQIAIAVLVVLVLGTAFLIVRARQATQSDIAAYCEVYDQTHDDITAAKTAATSTTTTPTTTPPGTTPGSTPSSTDTTIDPTSSTTVGTAPPGSVPPEATTTTTNPADDFNARVKSAAEKRSAVGPEKVRAAWAVLVRALSGEKLTAAQQSEIQTARTTVNDFAKNECGKDPPDL